MLALVGGNNFVRLFAMGYLGIVFVQLVINVGMNLGFLPVIGIPLPFMSYGGSNLLMLALGLGIVNSMRFRTG
jgi:rod shape determining protein RodA